MTNANVPLVPSDEEIRQIKLFWEYLPSIIRILKDLSDERYERLEEMTDTSRKIVEDLRL